MKDAFGVDLSVGDDVLFCPKAGSGGGTEYCVGNVVKEYPPTATVPHRVLVNVRKTSGYKHKKPVIVYASNVVVLPILAKLIGMPRTYVKSK